MTRQKARSFEDTRTTHKWHGSFPRTVRNSEEVQPSDDQAGAMHFECNGTQQLEQSEEGKRHKQQIPPAESVNHEEGWDSESKVDYADTHGPLPHLSEPVHIVPPSRGSREQLTRSAWSAL